MLVLPCSAILPLRSTQPLLRTTIMRRDGSVGLRNPALSLCTACFAREQVAAQLRRHLVRPLRGHFTALNYKFILDRVSYM